MRGAWREAFNRQRVITACISCKISNDIFTSSELIIRPCEKKCFNDTHAMYNDIKQRPHESTNTFEQYFVSPKFIFIAMFSFCPIRAGMETQLLTDSLLKH